MSHGPKGAKLTRMACAGLLAVASIIAVAGASPAVAATCAGTAPSDFNGDGISDAAIGEANPGSEGQGHVHVIYGTRHGLTPDASGTAPGDQLLSISTDTDRGFGSTVATGDFNGDGCSDLAVADPYAMDAAGIHSGAVDLYYGSPARLQTSPLLLNEMGTGGPSVRENDYFGYALAAADFNGDGLSDLVVGVPYQGLGGEFFIYPGNRLLSPVFGARRFVQGDGTVPGVDEITDRLGSAFATGDFNGDGRPDLAVGVPGEDDIRGAVFVIRGSGTSAFLTGTGSQIWGQDSTGILGTAENGDSFGWSLATGSFKGNGRTDLAIGAPFDEVGGKEDAGAVNVIYSAGSAGLTMSENQLWTQNSTGVGGAGQANAWFGFTLAAGDFNGNSRTDLAIGAPQATVSGAAEAGQVSVLVGTTGGLSGTGASSWSQATSGIAGAPEEADFFGNSATALRVTSATRDDLLVGARGEDLTAGLPEEGVVHLIRGSTGGLTATGSQLWSDDSAGIQGTACEGCDFGAAVG